MSDEEEILAPIEFSFEYTGHGWAHASISNGVTTYEMSPSYLPQDPLFVLVAAVDRILAYGGVAECTWHYEPPTDRWILRRAGDTLHITIREGADGLSQPSRFTDQGELRFSTACNVWKFAAKLRTVASRLAPPGEDYHDPTIVQRTPEYRALCAYLDDHKRAQRPPSSDGTTH